MRHSSAGSDGAGGIPPRDPVSGFQARISELEQQLAQLRHSHEVEAARLSSVLEGTNAASWEWNVETGETVFNDRWAEMVGYTLAELEPVSIQTWSRLAHPDDLQESSRRLARHFSHEEALYDCECRMKHRDGHWVWVHDRGKVVEWNADGSPLRMAGTHTDITQRKLDELRLRESEERYHALFEGTRAVKLVVDPADGRIVHVNAAACEFYGWPRERLESMNIREVNLLESGAVRGAMGEARLGTRNHFFFRHRLASGEVRDVEVYSSVIPLDGREMLNSIVHDITDRRRAERASAEFERQLHQAQKAESLSRMAGAVAHLFNNQLQAVMGNLELASPALTPGSAAATHAADALHAAQGAAQLSRLMLTYLGQAPGAREDVELQALCRDRASELRASLPARITLECESRPGTLDVRADPQQLRAVIDQLVANAVEAIGEGPGSIRMAVARVQLVSVPRAGRAPFDWLPGDQELACLQVTDTGCGIDGPALEQIFDPFYSTKFTGRGMGLPVVLGIVRTHGGGIVVQSEPGRGSSFRVYLPIAE